MKRTLTLSLLAALHAMACSGEPSAPVVPQPDASMADTASPPADAGTPPSDAPPDVAIDNPPACPAGQLRCGDVCVDTATSVAHCGRCGSACGAGLSCAQGTCILACPAGQVGCGTTCADLRSNTSHCGACGRACRAGQTCNAGDCRGTPTDCAPGMTGCDEACVDTATDRANCGACGRACAAGVACVAGVCAPTCSGTTTRCGAACFDLATDGANCGMCGRVCAAAQRCAAGACAACPAEPNFRDDFGRPDGALGESCYQMPGGAASPVIRSGAACVAAMTGESAAARVVPVGAGVVTVSFDVSVNGTETRMGARFDDSADPAGYVFAGIEPFGTTGLYVLAVRTRTAPVGTVSAPLLPPLSNLHLEAEVLSTGDVSVRVYQPMATGTPYRQAGGRLSAPPRFDRAGFTLEGASMTCLDNLAVTAAPCLPSLTACGSACVDLQTSLAHCGACGAACVVPTGGTNACVAGRCTPTCPAGSALNGNACEAVAATLSGLRWELPCSMPRGETWCTTSAAAPRSATLTGSAARSYDVRMRFRGVVERKTYSGGRADGPWYVGGAPASNPYNIYSLTVSDPAETYYLNPGPQADVCVALDFERTVRVRGNARLTLGTNTGTDTAQVNNRGAIVVPGIAPAPDAYDGQFIQMDVLSVTLVP